MEFKAFSKAVRDNFSEMAKKDLYVVDYPKDELYALYLSSFPEGSNPIYKERTEHDCNCCKNFIRDVGLVVSVKGNKLNSIWNLKGLDEVYGTVAKTMADKVQSMPIKGVFKHYIKSAGVLITHQQLEDNTIKKWNHFQCDIPRTHYSSDRNTILSGINSKVHVYKRGLTEITDEALNIVTDLISSNSIYRGQEFSDSIKAFRRHKKAYEKAANKDIFVWDTYSTNKSAAIRNTVIGTLLTDISDGKDLEASVAAYESKVAPQNYKRTSSLITKRMIDDAMKTVDDLGIRDSLSRRYAKINDVSVNNVLFVDRSVKSLMKDSIAELLESEVKTKPKSAKGHEDVNVEDFISKIMPKANGIKLFVENKHKSNLVSLITPEVKEAKSILQWDNNFSWSYNGDVTDSIKEKVKKAGGNVTGIVRVSLSWYNKDDLDLHVVEPNRNLIYYGHRRSATSGHLDVDMNVNNLVRDAVENITWTDRSKMPIGEYTVKVNNFTKRENIDVGFQIEVECNGQLYTYAYNKALRNSSTTEVVKFKFDGSNIAITKVNAAVETSGKSQDVWSIPTESFVEVDTVMYSPNYWDDQKVGNKHYIFTLKGCKNPDQTRGLYNEFLKSDLTKHRKVFEILGAKMKCKEQDEQLSGVGFSSTLKNSILCQVEGKVNKTYNIKF